MSRIGSWVEPSLRSLTLALILVTLTSVPAFTTLVGSQEPVPVNIPADEQSNATFVDADAFAPSSRLGIAPVPVGLLLPAVQSARGR